MRLIKSSIIAIVLFSFPMMLWAQDGSIKVKIKGLSCPFCVYGVEKKLKAIPGTLSVTTNYKQGTVLINKNEKAHVDAVAIEKAVVDAGFTVDFIALTVEGVLTQWQSHSAIKDKKSDQLFLLVESGKDHTNEFISSSKLKKLKASGGKPFIIKGKIHSHKGMPTALEVQ